jgi:hypothetical protein
MKSFIVTSIMSKPQQHCLFPIAKINGGLKYSDIMTTGTKSKYYKVI